MKIEEHLEHIDAHVFTGDQLHDVEMRAKFQWYLDRWQREMRALDNDIVDQLTEQFVTVLKEWTTPEDFAEMIGFVKKNGLRPILDTLFSLSDGEAALRRMEDARQFGKIVIKIN